MARRRVHRDVGKLVRPVLNGERTAVWYITWADGRSSRRISTGQTNRALAEEALIQWRAARLSRPIGGTVSDLLNHYIAERTEAGVKGVKAMVSALVHVHARLGPLTIDALTPPVIRGYLADRRRDPRRDGKPGRVSERAIALELAYLRAALRLAEKDGAIPAAPHVALPKNAGIKSRTRALSLAEVRALLRAAEAPETPPHVRTFVTLAIVTGQRGVAIRDLRWRDVDLERGVIWYSRSDPNPSPNKRRGDVRIPPGLVRHLAAMQTLARSTHVIEWDGRPVRSLKRALHGLFRRAGLDDVRSHDLRRTAATLALEGGASMAQTAALIRDSESVTEEHYAHASPDFLAPVVLAISSAIGLEDAPAGGVKGES